MGLEIFKKDNEFRQLTSIENCKKKIEEIVKKQQDIDQEFNVLESKFILINKNTVMKFLTEELNFMVYNNGQADVYNYQYKEDKYRIVVDINDFNEVSHIYFYMNQKIYEYDILCEYEDIIRIRPDWELGKDWILEKVWKMEEGCCTGNHIKRTDGTTPEENIQYWNDELDIAEKCYDSNYQALLHIKDLDENSRFYIRIKDAMENNYIEYDNLVELIRSELEGAD